MCCSTGLCGVSVDPELLRISTVLNTLKERGIEVKRYNLTNAPMEFVKNKVVSEFVKVYGADRLPVTVWMASLPFPAATRPTKNLPSGCPCRRICSASRSAAVMEDAADGTICTEQAPSNTVPVLHRQGWCRQDLYRLCSGHQPCRQWQARAAYQHRSRLQLAGRLRHGAP